ncbi:hypothetical protein [Sutcliffiella rhizosphaerae]|uniref:Uncharacterized protein n=1 Tax=Sutcliffiella rhizosphaerae TaxID=2880967 RepID=A0ABN8A8K6_9BACI|nr:hypothetical protein [Sutcliffiella rhizosphaerae]CAG9621489.1 hypothetical protein BACCIP111883_02262 [Sutcliffiella rhizosphaerae]
MYDTYKGLTKILWGFLFVLVDIRIEFVDIFPDFIGYGMVAYGLMQLELDRERNWATLLALISFPSFFITAPNYLNLLYEDYYISTTIYYTVIGVIHLVLIVSIINKLSIIAEKKGLFEIAKRAHTRITIYTVLHVVSLIGTPFLINIGEAMAFTFTLLFILLFIFEILILVLITKFRRLL